MRLASNFMGYEHHVAVPRYNPLKVGTLDDILGDVAEYLEIGQDEVDAGIVQQVIQQDLPAGGVR